MAFAKDFIWGAAAAAYQVEGAKNAMMLNIGGSATTNYVFIIGNN